MMKFQAKHVTLEAELKQLNGLENTVSAPPLSSKKAGELLDRLIKEDNDFDSKHPKNEAIYAAMAEHYARQLAEIYGTEPSYWLENFDGPTVANVKRYVIDELLGVTKKE